MDPVETLLQGRRTAVPSPELDRRVNAAFARALASDNPPGLRLASVFARALMVAGIGVAAASAIFFFRPARPPPGSRQAGATTVYHIEATGPLQQLLLTPAPQAPPAPFVIHAEYP